MSSNQDQSRQLAEKTLAGIYEFCKLFITNEEAKMQILSHIHKLFQNWNEFWPLIKEWLCNISFETKEQVLVDFVEKIPALQIFQDIIQDLLKFHSSFWDAVYENLFQCKKLLID